jgi:hypothetical protein
LKAGELWRWPVARFFVVSKLTYAVLAVKESPWKKKPNAKLAFSAT